MTTDNRSSDPPICRSLQISTSETNHLTEWSHLTLHVLSLHIHTSCLLLADGSTSGYWKRLLVLAVQPSATIYATFNQALIHCEWSRYPIVNPVPNSFNNSLLSILLSSTNWSRNKTNWSHSSMNLIKTALASTAQ